MTAVSPAPPRLPRLVRVIRVSVVLAGVGLGACGSDQGDEPAPNGDRPDGPVVVVTYSVLGDVVRQLVGDSATVEVIIPNGQDPHDYAASARDVETMTDAALVVANGLDLEEGLEESLVQVEDAGVTVFYATDHITVRRLDADEAAAAGDDGDGHHHDGGDPHIWTDPNVIAELAPDLAAALETTLGVQLDGPLAELQDEMTELDATVRSIIGAIPAGRCQLVTGHESLGYFADRYGCELIGSVIPSLSSTAEASAGDLAELIAVARDAGVAAIFTEVGTTSRVADQVADELDVPVVALPSHSLPDVGGYPAFIVDLATLIANGVTGAA